MIVPSGGTGANPELTGRSQAHVRASPQGRRQTFFHVFSGFAFAFSKRAVYISFMQEIAGA